MCILCAVHEYHEVTSYESRIVFCGLSAVSIVIIYKK
jgi:hypothetical protein